MIALKKLESLPARNRLRKTAELLRNFEEAIRQGTSIDGYYLAGLCTLLRRTDTENLIGETAAQLEKDLRSRKLSLADNAPPGIGRQCGMLSALLLQSLGLPQADWDLRQPASGSLDPATRRILALDLYLEDLRSPFNVGSIFRSAEAFGVRHIYLSPSTPTPEQPRARRSAMGTAEIIPWSVSSLTEAAARSASDSGTAVPGHRVIALETGGQHLSEFDFPEAGLMIIGNEEWGVSDEALSQADGRVSILMGGAKASLNVAVATGIALQRWSEQVLA